MSLSLTLAAAAASLVLAQAAPVAEAPAAAAPAPAAGRDLSGVTVTGKTKPDENSKEVVCHSETVLGSMFPKKVCASRQAFTERRREDQKWLRDSTLLNPLKVN
jgi:invasion protein IalB